MPGRCEYPHRFGADDGNSGVGAIHLPVREKSDGALMVRFAGVRVDVVVNRGKENGALEEQEQAEAREGAAPYRQV